MSHEQQITIDALGLPSEDTDTLGWARSLGLTKRWGAVSRIAGTAQAIRSFGKEEILKNFPDGLPVTLSVSDKAELDWFTHNEQLQTCIAYAASLPEMNFSQKADLIKAKFLELNGPSL